jgi:hypothetical protein
MVILLSSTPTSNVTMYSFGYRKMKQRLCDRFSFIQGFYGTVEIFRSTDRFMLLVAARI